jgi:hypothetical protein
LASRILHLIGHFVDLATLCTNYTPWKRSFKGLNMLEWHKVLMTWWPNHIWVHLSVLIWHSLRESFEVFCKQPCFVVESHPGYWLPKFLQSLQANLETVHRNRLNSAFTHSCNSSAESSFSKVLHGLCTLWIFVFSDVTPCSLVETTVSAEPTPYSLKMKPVRSLCTLVTTYQIKRRHLYGKLKLHTLLTFIESSDYTNCSNGGSNYTHCSL